MLLKVLESDRKVAFDLYSIKDHIPATVVRVQCMKAFLIVKCSSAANENLLNRAIF